MYERFGKYRMIEPPVELKLGFLGKIKYNYFYRKYDHFQEFSVPRHAILNQSIKKFKFRKYLEIGVFDGKNFDLINVDYKVGIDPTPNSTATFKLTSDDFFRQNKEKFDIIFIDGHHESTQLYRDILNSLEFLNKGGIVLCHDVNPWNKVVQMVPQRTGTWTGDCWKAIVRLRTERDDLEICVIDTDCGIGIIRRGSQRKLEIRSRLNWKHFDSNRVEWLNLISVDEFYEKLN